MTIKSQPKHIIVDNTSQASFLSSYLKSALYESKLVLFIGSGISQFAPAHVPSGQLASRLLRTSAEQFVAQFGSKKNVSRGIQGMPFEMFMTRLQELTGEDVAENFVKELVKVEKPNPIHLQIGALINECRIKGVDLSLITTNYDVGVELAVELQLQNSAPGIAGYNNVFTSIINKNDIHHARECQTRLFKPHGSINVPGSFVFDYEREFTLTPWKKEYLQELLSGKTLLVVGYSGWDLDIADALFNCNLESIVWCRRDADDSDIATWSPSAAHLMESVYDSYIVNTNFDIQAPIDLIIPRIETVFYQSESVDAKFTQAIQSLPLGINEAWFAWVVLRSGFGKIGLATQHIIDNNSLIPIERRLEFAATSYFYQGKHAKAAKIISRAANLTHNVIFLRPYFRASEISFWNRGNYSLRALFTLLQGLIETFGLIFDPKKRYRFFYTFVQIFTQIKEFWPMHLLGRFSRMLANLCSWMDRRVGLAEDYPVAELVATWESPLFSRVKKVMWLYTWLGQKARLINLYRWQAKNELKKYQETGTPQFLQKALRLALISALRSKLVGDPARMGKACLLAAEIAFEAQYTNLPHISAISVELNISGDSWKEVALCLGRIGWKLLFSAEIWYPSVVPNYWLYIFITGKTGKFISHKLKQKIISAAFRFAGV